MSGGSSFWVSFAKTLPFMLVCGIVGPIFLVVYLLVGEPAVRWLLWWGLVITIGDVVLAVVIARAASGAPKASSRQPSAELYGAVQAPPVGAPASALGSPAERLTELDELMRKDLISTEEYDASRARILGEL